MSGQQQVEGEAVISELRRLVRDRLGVVAGGASLLSARRLGSRSRQVYRLRIRVAGRDRWVIAKSLSPAIAERAQRVATRWLREVGMGRAAPRLLAAASDGGEVWHLYEDLGERGLDGEEPDRPRIGAAVDLIARLHGRFAEHRLLAECRLLGGDLGSYFYEANVRDALRAVKFLRPPAVPMTAEQEALRDRLLHRLCRMREEGPARSAALAAMGGRETLLHGDLWRSNTFVIPMRRGARACLIDWDHAAVGPACYDLSTFLTHFPQEDRIWILDRYRRAVRASCWTLPPRPELNLLFETVEMARFANRLIWPAIALAREPAAWAHEELAEVERWFESYRPLLPNETTSPRAAAAVH